MILTTKTRNATAKYLALKNQKRKAKALLLCKAGQLLRLALSENEVGNGGGREERKSRPMERPVKVSPARGTRPRKIDEYKSLTYTDGDALLKFTCKRGKILSRRETKVRAKEHRRMAKLIKTARIHKVLPFSRVYKEPKRNAYEKKRGGIGGRIFSSKSTPAPKKTPKREEVSEKKVNWRDYKKDWREGLPAPGSWRKKYGFKGRKKRKKSVAGTSSNREEK